MKILAIDTATEACSAALYIDGLITEQYQLAPREHTKLLLKMVESLLEQADLQLKDLDALAFGCGPGSFTGVRISTGVIQGLAFASDLPVLPVSTLAALAQMTYDKHGFKAVLSGIDARMGEMYWAYYQLAENNLMVLIGEEKVSSALSIKFPIDLSHKCCGAGSGWDSYSVQLNEALGDRITDIYADYLPHASSIAKLAVEDFNQGLAIKAAEALPVYLRNDVAKKKADQ